MNRIVVFLLLVLSPPCFAKEKPRIVIQVLKSQASTYQRNIFVPGTRGSSQTNCNTNGSAINTGIVTTGSATTNCSTTGTAATGPYVRTKTIAQEYVGASMPDGRKVVLWCQQGFRKCDALAPGRYWAEVDGNSLFIYVPDLSGRAHKVKYKAVTVEPPSLPSPSLSAPSRP